jgi:hypothetical protein
MPYLLVISYEFKIREKKLSTLKTIGTAIGKRLVHYTKGTRFLNFCCFHTLYQKPMRMYESMSKIKFMHGSDQAKKTSG